jgi:diguanylate cyclase (GGDEF)-like protein
MDDLFAYEQEVFNNALQYADEFDDAKFRELAKEYGRLLKQLRRATKVSDRTTITLNTSKHDLLGKVHYDALTGMFNRRYLEENLTKAIKSTARGGGELSVLMLDIDFFKRYNDTYGHGEGDNCLKAVADAIMGCLSRADDFAARYGGEEFTVVLPNTGESGARLMSAKILEAMRAKEVPHERSDAAPHVTLSIGATTAAAVHTQSGDGYLRQADKALYQSKDEGRNRYTFVDYCANPAQPLRDAARADS